MTSVLIHSPTQTYFDTEAGIFFCICGGCSGRLRVTHLEKVDDIDPAKCMFSVRPEYCVECHKRRNGGKEPQWPAEFKRSPL